MTKTLLAMKRVSEVKTKREDLFYRMRMRAHKGLQRDQIRNTIKKGMETMVPAAADREKAIANATKSVRERTAKAETRKAKMQN
jgi:hypothetical protein